jgi:hypothetical protein
MFTAKAIEAQLIWNRFPRGDQIKSDGQVPRATPRVPHTRRPSGGDPRDQPAAFVAVAERCKPLRLAHTTRRLKILFRCPLTIWCVYFGVGYCHLRRIEIGPFPALRQRHIDRRQPNAFVANKATQSYNISSCANSFGRNVYRHRAPSFRKTASQRLTLR